MVIFFENVEFLGFQWVNAYICNMKTKRILAILAAIAVVAVAIAVYVASKYVENGESTEDCWMYVPADATNESIRDSLVKSVGNTTGENVYTLWSLMGGKPAVAHGAYLIKAGESPLDIYRKLSRGAQTPIKVTFNNIRTLDEFANRVASRMEFTADEFLSACDSILPKKGFNKATYPAAFIPDSYEFYWTASPEKFINTLYRYYERFWTAERVEKAKQNGLTPIEVSTLASIVEEETNRKDERPVVARLYMNRLDRGMKLQADPTVKFAVGDFSLRRILNVHLAKNSPYNTYMYAGLPPGPIRIPDRSTLEAVLNAPKNNYLYMCAAEDFSGRHNFTSDYNQHLRNATRYQRALNARKIK